MAKQNGTNRTVLICSSFFKSGIWLAGTVQSPKLKKKIKEKLLYHLYLIKLF